jgi:CBS domain-containing protein
MACIQDRVNRQVVTLESTATCAEAARLMRAHGIGSLGVRQGSRLVGFVTERDLVNAMATGGDASRTSLAQAMQANAPVVSAKAGAEECARLMRAHRTRHLAVQEGGEIVGVLSLLDLVDLVVEEKQWNIDQLETYIRGGRAQQLSQPMTSVFHHERIAAS